MPRDSTAIARIEGASKQLVGCQPVRDKAQMLGFLGVQDFQRAEFSEPSVFSLRIDLSRYRESLRTQIP
jgi:hypothetical protein